MGTPATLARIESWCAGILPRDTALLVAVSGGSDSTAAFHILHALQPVLGIRRLGIAHVNHRLRGDASDEDERFVRGIAERTAVPFFVKRLSGRSIHDPGVEEWARRERYAFFSEVRTREGFDLVATGHTADDQAETVLFRLLRGTGLRGLRGILPLREDGIVRPLLPLRKPEILEWLYEQDIEYRNDDSNDDRTFRRNMLRHETLPILERGEPGAAVKLATVADRARECWELVKPGVDRWIGNHVVKTEAGFTIVKNGLEDEFHMTEGVRSVFEEFGIAADADHIDAIMVNGRRCEGEFLLPGGWRYVPRNDEILFCKTPAPDGAPFFYPLTVPGDTECPAVRARFTAEVLPYRAGEPIPGDNLTVLLDYDRCGTRLIYRSWRREDRFDPLGSGRWFSVAEFLAKQKFGRQSRTALGIVEAKDGAIVWIPGIRISQTSRITASTRHVVKICYKSLPAIV
jgi:tRNA(Ile)-lysidine synthase